MLVKARLRPFDSIVFSLRNKNGNLILVQMYLYTIGNELCTVVFMQPQRSILRYGVAYFVCYLSHAGLHGKIISVMLSNHPLILYPLRS